MNRLCKKFMTYALVTALSLSCLAGCGGASTSDTKETGASKTETAEAAKTEAATQTTDGEKKLKIGELWAITSVDPVNNGTLMKEKAMVTEVLCSCDDNFNIIPGLAESWENVDEKTWVFKLREDVKFHDGTDMDGEAVAWSINNALTVNPTLATQTGIVSVEASGDYEVTIKTETPNAEIPEYMHLAGLGIIAKSTYDDAGNLVKAIGTGAFMVDNFDQSTGVLTIVKNPDYYNGVSSIDVVTLSGMTDSNTRAMALESGEVDFTCDVPFNEIDRLNAMDNVRIESYDTARVYCSMMNINGIFADQKLREAVSYAIDRETISTEVLNGCGSPAKNIYTENMAWCNTEIDGSTFDTAKASALLEEAGYTDTDNDGYVDKDGENLSFRLLTYTERPGLPLIAEAVQAQLKTVGIKVEVTTMENAGIQEEISKGDWGMYLAGNATCMTPSCIYFIKSNYYSATNKYGYANPEMDKLIDQCINEFDTAKRFEISKEIQELAMKDLPIVYICNYGVAYGFNSRVSNFKFNPTAHDYMWNVDITID